MRILFLHPNFPAQFRHLAIALAQYPHNEVIFGTKEKQAVIPGVKKVIYEVSREPAEQTHHYLRNLESAVLEGQGCYRMALELKKSGFYPDIIYAHSGWGIGLFMKDLFPKAKYLCYFEWFYHAHGSDADFDPDDPLDADTEAKIRIKNAPILIDLASCDAGLTPTLWQKQQFPPEFHGKLKVIHDGIDTKFFQPHPQTKLIINTPNSPTKEQILDLSSVEEIVTYVSRGLEPYRGFPQFMEAVALLQQQRPYTHVVIVATDRVAYGKTLPNGQTYKQLMLEKLELDLSRIHFTGHLPYSQYLKVLQASSVHVYLTRPFVLSWSLLESMATGCAIVASNTLPVQELIKDQFNGFLVNFFQPQAIAENINMVLDNLDSLKIKSVKENARKTISDFYDLENLLPVHLHWLKSFLQIGVKLAKVL